MALYYNHELMLHYSPQSGSYDGGGTQEEGGTVWLERPSFVVVPVYARHVRLGEHVAPWRTCLVWSAIGF